MGTASLISKLRDIKQGSTTTMPSSSKKAKAASLQKSVSQHTSIATEEEEEERLSNQGIEEVEEIDEEGNTIQICEV